MEGARLTCFAKQMEAAGLISRRVDQGDNRFTLITLAPARKRNCVIYALFRTREAGKMGLLTDLTLRPKPDDPRVLGAGSTGGVPPRIHTPRRCTYAAGLDGMDGDGVNAYYQAAHLGRVVRPATTHSTGRAVPAARCIVLQ
jgi:hypothetical protein